MHPKICVLGLDCAAPEILFGDERLKNIRHLMGLGTWGRLESVVPPITVPGWLGLATSRDPGSRAVYVSRTRATHTSGGFGFVDSRSIREPAIGITWPRTGRSRLLWGCLPVIRRSRS